MSNNLYKTELKILFPEKEVKIGENTLKCRQWGALKASKNLSRIGDPIFKLTEVANNPNILTEVINESYDTFANIVSEDYEIEREQIDELPAEWFIELVKGIMEVNESFLKKLKDLQDNLL